MPKYSTVIPTSGENGNIFVIVGHDTRLLRRLGTKQSEITEFQNKISHSSDHQEALSHVREYFPLEGD